MLSEPGRTARAVEQAAAERRWAKLAQRGAALAAERLDTVHRLWTDPDPGERVVT